MQLADVPTFALVRVLDFGSVELIEGFPAAVDDVVAVWTRCQSDENPFATVEIRGIVGARSTTIDWLPADARVELVQGPRYAGQPEELAAQATPIDAPAGSKGVVKTADGWPALIWESDLVHSPVQGWTDAEIAVETLMCALAVAPIDGDPRLRPMLLAGLKARFVKLTRDQRTYPPERYPWRGRTAPGPDMIEYLAG